MYYLAVRTSPIDTESLDFELEGDAQSWIAIGLSKTPTMVNMCVQCFCVCIILCILFVCVCVCVCVCVYNSIGLMVSC